MKNNTCTLKRGLFRLAAALALLSCVQNAPAQLTNLGIAYSGGAIVVFYPTNATNLILQSATDLVASNWTTVTDAVPVVAVSVANSSTARYFRLYSPPQVPVTNGMILISAGTFTMGDTLDGESDAIPTVSVSLSSFYMDTNLVSYGQWQTVYSWATTNGYTFNNPGAGKDTNHPVQTVDWYDAVKWCNARSQMDGLTPLYYTDPGFTNLYTNGEVASIYVEPGVTGYRLPTEAEWEDSSRGGLAGQRFPLGNTISENQANYVGYTNFYSYDLGPNGYNPFYSTGSLPYTSPVGSFPPNAFGLFDMAGNVLEWCFDWNGTYAGGSNPVGLANLDGNRILRGGDWANDASGMRCARRWKADPTSAYNVIGFRCVRPLYP